MTSVVGPPLMFTYRATFWWLDTGRRYSVTIEDTLIAGTPIVSAIGLLAIKSKIEMPIVYKVECACVEMSTKTGA